MNDATALKFLKDLKKTCKENGVHLYKSKKSVIAMSPGIYCSGYFQETPKRVLAIATGSPEWFPVLVHESCHMDQWLEKSPLWENNVSCDYVDAWLGGDRVRNIEGHINNVRDLELDCEKRVVEKIKQLGLNINIEEYIQKANCYVLFYNYIKTTRAWAKPGKSPYLIEELWRHAPNYFLDNYDNDVLVLKDKFDEFEVCK